MQSGQVITKQASVVVPSTGIITFTIPSFCKNTESGAICKGRVATAVSAAAAAAAAQV
jgi:hypothetical protein